MSDYISREAVLAEEATIKGYSSLKFVMVDDINAIPSADVRENIHGTWEEWKGSRYLGMPICSNCKIGFSFNAKQYNFCPNCGADMRGESDVKR